MVHFSDANNINGYSMAITADGVFGVGMSKTLFANPIPPTFSDTPMASTGFSIGLSAGWSVMFPKTNFIKAYTFDEISPMTLLPK